MSITHRLVNLTQHHLRVKTADGRIITIRSDVADGRAMLPTVDEKRSETVFNAVFTTPDGHGVIPFFMYEIERGRVSNLPQPRPGVLYIVAQRVLDAIKDTHPERIDFIATGNVERDKGVIQYAFGFHYYV